LEGGLSLTSSSEVKGLKVKKGEKGFSFPTFFLAEKKKRMGREIYIIRASAEGRLRRLNKEMGKGEGGKTILHALRKGKRENPYAPAYSQAKKNGPLLLTVKKEKREEGPKLQFILWKKKERGEKGGFDSTTTYLKEKKWRGCLEGKGGGAISRFLRLIWQKERKKEEEGIFVDYRKLSLRKKRRKKAGGSRYEREGERKGLRGDWSWGKGEEKKEGERNPNC